MSERLRKMTTDEAKAHLNEMFPGNEGSNFSFWTRLLDNSFPNDELGRTVLLQLNLGRFNSRVFQSSIYVLAKRATGELTTPDRSIDDGSEEIESNFYREALSVWQKYLTEDCPVSINNPAELWELIKSNEVTTRDLAETIRIGLVGATSSHPAEESQSYRAAAALRLLRDTGFLPTPVDGSRPYYFKFK